MEELAVEPGKGGLDVGGLRGRVNGVEFRQTRQGVARGKKSSHEMSWSVLYRGREKTSNRQEKREKKKERHLERSEGPS